MGGTISEMGGREPVGAMLAVEEAGAGSTVLELVGETISEDGGKAPVGCCALLALEVVGRMTSEGAGELPVGAIEGSRVAWMLLVVVRSVSAGIEEVKAAEDVADVVGVTISEIGGRTPVGADDDRCTT